jgi:sugar/nucleoside kinase (ribokinase family)
VLFLANIQPTLQLDVLDQCTGPRWTALDSMNLWIDIARDDLVKVIERVDCLVLNDAEIRQLTRRPSIVRAARELLSWGPSAIVAKQGEYGAALITEEGFFALPAYPLEVVIDPTGAGDTFAGGLAGYVAAHPGEPVSHDLLTRAIAYGTALASFNVEEFGTERVARLGADEVGERVTELAKMTSFSAAPLALRS